MDTNPPEHPVTVRVPPPCLHCTGPREAEPDLAVMLRKMDPFHYTIIKLPVIMFLMVKRRQ